MAKSKKTDDARSVAAASDGYLNTDQVRVLRALKGTTKKSGISMEELKKRLGFKPEQRYSSGFLNAVKELAEYKCINISLSPNGRLPEEGRRKKFYYSIMASGAKALASAEKASAA